MLCSPTGSLASFLQHPPGFLMSPSLVKHLFAHSSASKSRSLPHSPVTRAIDEVDGESSWFGAVSRTSSSVGNTTDREAYENDRRTPPPRTRWNLNTWLDRLHLHADAHRDDTAVDFDGEAIGQIAPLTSSVEEVAISQDDIVIACVSVAHLLDSRS
ncbi:hypothetical protein EDD15DRAFT_1069302 [Pisolithus albus]|nr:hypothetical protein EDD15DRAFT_1069302 [Pisolithus albus]